MSGKTIKIGDDKRHPTLKAVKAALKKNPKLTKFFLATAFGVGYATLSSWEKNGWIKTGMYKRDNQSNAWGKFSVASKPYDFNMVKVKK